MEQYLANVLVKVRFVATKCPSFESMGNSRSPQPPLRAPPPSPDPAILRTPTRLTVGHADAGPEDMEARRKFTELVIRGNLQSVEKVLRISGTEDSARLMEGTGYAVPTMVLAALTSPVEMVRLLIAHGAEVESTTSCETDGQCVPLGSTPLHCAASQGRLDIVLALLEAGASPNSQDSQEATPIWYVTRFEEPANHVAITRALLEAGSDPRLTDIRGATPFHVAAGRGSIEVVDMLLEKAPCILNQPTANGATALYLAATEPGLDEMVSHLLSRGGPQTRLCWATAAARSQGPCTTPCRAWSRSSFRKGGRRWGGPWRSPGQSTSRA